LHYHPIEKLVAQKPLRKLKKEIICAGNDMDERDFHSIEMGLSQEELINML